jgi:hypothetical protein
LVLNQWSLQQTFGASLWRSDDPRRRRPREVILCAVAELVFQEGRERRRLFMFMMEVLKYPVVID